MAQYLSFHYNTIYKNKKATNKIEKLIYTIIRQNDKFIMLTLMKKIPRFTILVNLQVLTRELSMSENRHDDLTPTRIGLDEISLFYWCVWCEHIGKIRACVSVCVLRHICRYDNGEEKTRDLESSLIIGKMKMWLVTYV